MLRAVWNSKGVFLEEYEFSIVQQKAIGRTAVSRPHLLVEAVS